MEGYDWDKVFSAGNQPPKSDDSQGNKPANPGHAMSDEELKRAMAAASPSDPKGSVPEPAKSVEESQPEPIAKVAQPEPTTVDQVAVGELPPISEPPATEEVAHEQATAEEVPAAEAPTPEVMEEAPTPTANIEPIPQAVTAESELAAPTMAESPIEAEPVITTGNLNEIPFNDLDEIVEAAGKGPIDPSLSPYSAKEPEPEVELVAEAQELEESIALAEEDVASQLSEESNVEEPVAKSTGDPEKDKLLSLFAKKGPKDAPKAKKEEVKLTLSEINTADTNRTTFDAHKQADSKINRYSGGEPIGDTHIDEILRMAVERRCSDIHITADLPPMLRVDGEIVPLPFAPMQPQDTRRLLYDTLDDEKIQKFESTKELDFGYPVKDLGRFRVNMFVQRGSVGGVLRVIPMRIPLFEELGLPPVIKEMSKRASGLILVTGPTGSGKSTTIATIIDDINANRRGHIMTIEDPIEYLHMHKQSIVNQREMHSDTYSFHNALRAVLREDPDIILVGELRDLETIEAALTLAETGHLVFGTLHTRNAPSTIDRIIDVFPPESQEQIRVLLANTIEGVVSQQLLPRLGGGRVASIEVMLGTPAIKNLVREGKTHQMQSILETSGNVGMQTMDASLAELYRSGKCEFDECHLRAIDRDTFIRLAKAA
ncbi:MAG: PilT/PilU family type 4a pilus ATPase [Chthonomonas sp.]|nr:PilT/PilU family type 4a pilus ATPase [Chthonomonas sp.]